ncbi:hypothetical protein CEXT_179761 [Caerostris extrusa]|uniref:Uncharacterized protein n=1 Tax=Caerostris extrusa TaxID=172846 RepID=A0AAV4WKP6_CAEEX|nr:hypothetical protein CEXT_179761 [Caerostris extrusa]
MDSRNISLSFQQLASQLQISSAVLLRMRCRVNVGDLNLEKYCNFCLQFKAINQYFMNSCVAEPLAAPPGGAPVRRLPGQVGDVQRHHPLAPVFLDKYILKI